MASSSLNENAIEMELCSTAVALNTEPLISVAQHNDDNNKKQSLTNNDTNSNAQPHNSEKHHTEDKEPSLEKHFYSIIFGIIVPYIWIGCPYNYCFKKEFSNVHRAITVSSCMMIYTCCVLVLAHAVMLAWLTKLVWSMFTVHHLNEALIADLFTLSYILAGVIALDIVWLNRSAIREVLTDLLDYCPLTTDYKYQTLLTDQIGTLKYYRIKFTLLRMLSYVMTLLLLIYFGYIIYTILQAYTDTDPEGYTEWWNRGLELIAIYAVFFFCSDATLLLSLLWAIQYKVKHLNLFVKNLTTGNESPNVEDIEIVKIWYRNIVDTVRKIDHIFSLYIAVYIGFFFLCIIYFVSKTLDLFKNGGLVENVLFLSMAGLAFVVALTFFYGLKEFTDVHEHSSDTRSIMYDYVLNTKPEQRSTAFFEEVNLVAQGLLNKPATFTLLGQIELNKSFMVHLAVVVYSYALVFHQFHQKIPKSFTAP